MSKRKRRNVRPVRFEGLEGRVMLSTYFVSPTGSDSANGSLATPWQTVQKAINAAASGDTIDLRAGTYSGGISIGKSNLTIQAYNGEKVSIAAPYNNSGIYFDVYVGSGVQNVTLSNLDLSGGYYYTVKLDSTFDNGTNPSGQGASHITFDHVAMHDSGSHVIKISPESNYVTLQYCQVYNSGRNGSANGIDAVNANYLHVTDTYVHDINNGDAFFAKGGSTGVVAEHNLITNANTGILLGQDTDDNFFDLVNNPNKYEAINSVARNNIIMNVKYAGIGTYSGYNLSFYNNTIINAAGTGQAGFWIAQNHNNTPGANITAINNIIGVSGTGPNVMITYAGMTGNPVMSNNRYTNANGQSGFEDDRNGFAGMLSSWQSHIGGDANSSQGNPGVDSTGHLVAGSAAINTGKTLTSFSDDYDHQSRPSGSAWDIGADEYQGTTPPPTTNAAPTVATPAKANPSPVTGNTTVLSVLGADDGGEANLTYTWSVLSAPSSAGAPSLSANGTNAAKNTTVTFQAAGVYTFQATIKDAGGLTVTSNVSVTVNQTLTSIRVTPGTATILPSATQQFTATGLDQFGKTMAATCTWSTSGGGTINTSGMFTAGSTAGGPYTVTATSGTMKGTASVTVSSTTNANLALNRPTYASSVEGGTTAAGSANLGAAMATDSSTSTRWSSAFSDPQWIYVDLGGTYNVNRVVLNWEAASAAAYQLQVSNDAVNWTTFYSTTSSTGGVQNLTGLTGIGRYVRMYGTQRNTPYGYSLYDFQVYGMPSTPVATPTLVSLNKPTYASSVEGGTTAAGSENLSAAMATDGSTSTRWSSAFSDPQWIYVDLGANYNITKVVLNWEAASAKAYQIQVSSDGTNWTSIYSTTSSTGGVQTLNLTGTGRYVRMYGTQRNTVYGYSLYDFQVWGTLA